MLVDRNNSWWQRTKKMILLFIFLSCILFIIYAYIFQITWTGFVSYQDPNMQGFHPTKTLWDWLQLLTLPFFVSIVAYLLNSSDSARERRMLTQRDETERTIASENQQAILLRDYLDRMSNLLLEHNLRDTKNSLEARNIARAHTLIVLPHLNDERKGRLVQFLYESQLIISNRKDCILLHNADLSNADLRDFNLSGANLSGANLTGAKLSGVNLSESLLLDTSLHKADLSGAILRSADLRKADLRETILNGAVLQDADLSQANLSDAWLVRTDLRGADLRDAIVNRARLEQAICDKETISKVQLSKMQKL